MQGFVLAKKKKAHALKDDGRGGEGESALPSEKVSVCFLNFMHSFGDPARD